MPLIKHADSYFISAGEHSGDLLGADLVLALREHLPKMASFGIAGSAMVSAGVEEIASTDEFSVMGVFEIAQRLPALRMLETRILHWIDQRKPKFAILIDNPGFHLRLAEQLRMRGIRVFQYVAPKLWAWGEGRLPRLKENFDLVLGILPFEEEFFVSRGVNYTYVGSPLKDRIDKVIITREALGIPKGQTVIACLPGSRMAEVRLNLPTIQAVRRAVARELPEALFLVPVSSNLAIEDLTACLSSGAAKAFEAQYRAAGEGFAAESWEIDGLRFVRGMSLEVMAAADAAVVTSGTATLECALLGTPLVVIYTMNDFTYQLAKRAVRLPYVSLVNLMAGRLLAQEYIQEFSVSDVATELLSLVKDAAKRKAVQESFEDIRDKLKGAAANNAAQAIAANFRDPQP